MVRSEEFDNAAWGKFRATVDANVGSAPNGTLTVDKLVENTDNNTHFAEVSVTFTAVQHSFSVFAKAGERSWLRLVAIDGAAYFDLSNGAVGSVSAGTVSLSAQAPVDAGGGWFRCTVIFTPPAASNVIQVRLASGNNVQSYLGDGYSGIYVWGAQLEAGAFPTSYIPTSGSTVTRAGEGAIISGSSFNEFWNNTEMTIYHEASLPTIAEFDAVVYSFDDNTANYNEVYFTKGAYPNGFIGYVRNNNTTDASLANSTALPSDDFHKAAFGLKVDDVALSVNDATLLTDTSVYRLPPATRLMLGGRSLRTAAYDNKLHIKKLAIYPKRLPNATLQAMTEE